jgi:hypothetical protein
MPRKVNKRALGFPQYHLLGIGDKANAGDRGIFEHCIDTRDLSNRPWILRK